MKKLPFKPTALRKQFLSNLNAAGSDAKRDDDGLDLFRRSREMARVVEADRERQLKKKLQQEKQRRQSDDGSGKRPRDDGQEIKDDDPFSEDGPALSRRASTREEEKAAAVLSQTKEPSDPITPPASKRSRLDHRTPSKITAPSLDDVETAAIDPPSARVACPRPQLQTPSKRRAESSPRIISLDSSDESADSQTEDGNTRETGSKTPARRPVDDTGSSPLPVEDDEFGEYVRKAEAQRARDRNMLAGRAMGSERQETVCILITSNVPEAKLSCFKFLYGKPLRLVRDKWAALQRQNNVQLPEDDDHVILTWRRKRVYNSSNLLSLGIRPQSDGSIGVEDFRIDGMTPDRSKVHMEAWTPDLFEAMEREEEMRRRREAGDLLSEESDDDDDDDSEEEDSAAARAKMRLTLKARGFDNVGLTVLPETTVDTLVTGFRTQRSIGPDQVVSIWFDGERLEEHVTMEEAEVDDLDTLEVHVR
ncbi:hypothetical protein L249_6785 [Ophiocordyceps polyrhachis-furcata BCC 54312]|uniref:Ubiquitin-like domain-containing protein n=1 Tax=Ophiocordyceps polyrhachis-furcata BCC 54312 TaxID=1330021 RepID=A0A367LK87_9HYPO|nr:hypothetical protein L249_6785 [Ophiocordyceps polyrhachis-furcata BCC 54312]